VKVILIEAVLEETRNAILPEKVGSLAMDKTAPQHIRTCQGTGQSSEGQTRSGWTLVKSYQRTVRNAEREIKPCLH
jgi:hypothetical protein